MEFRRVLFRSPFADTPPRHSSAGSASPTTLLRRWSARFSKSRQSVSWLICAGLLRMVDDEDFNGSFCWHQLDAEFIQDGINRGFEHAFAHFAWPRGFSALGCRLADFSYVQFEVKLPRESGLIKNRLIGTKTREKRGQGWQVFQSHVIGFVRHRVGACR